MAASHPRGHLFPGPASPSPRVHSMPRFFAQLMVFTLLATCGFTHADPLPESVDLRAGYDRLGLECRSQGSRGTCSLFAVTAIANYEAAMKSPSRIERFSEEYLVWAADKAT